MEFQTLAAMQSLNPRTITEEDFPAKYLFLALDNLKIGMSLIDRRMRFVSVNSSLAEINHLPAEAHAGRSLREVMGVFAAKIWPLVQHVFSTGKTLSDVQVSGKLPNREDVAHWTEWYFPILNKSGLITQVGVIVMEVRPKPRVDPRMCPSCLEAQDKTSMGLVAQRSADRIGLMRPPRFNGEVRGSKDLPRQKRCLSIPLSGREKNVLKLLATGNANKEIASLLSISVKTVETYRSRLMTKLQISSLVRLVHYAIRHNLVELQAE